MLACDGLLAWCSAALRGTKQYQKSRDKSELLNVVVDYKTVTDPQFSFHFASYEALTLSRLGTQHGNDRTSSVKEEVSNSGATSFTTVSTTMLWCGM